MESIILSSLAVGRMGTNRLNKPPSAKWKRKQDCGSPSSKWWLKIHFGLSTQYYYLAERVSGEYGTGTGEEFTDADPDNPTEGIYIPIWMPLADLPDCENVYPLDIAKLVANSFENGWPDEPILVVENQK